LAIGGYLRRMDSVAKLPSPPSLGELGRKAPIALFLDFDGTLIDIAETPEGIVVPEGFARGLEALSRRLGGRLALISGRAVANLEGHCGGPLGIAIAGSHGLSRFSASRERLGAKPQPLPDRVFEAFTRFATDTGLHLENKAYGAALHYRADPSLAERAEAFAGSLAEEHGLMVKRGKYVVELVPPGADKGTAVRAFMSEPPFAGTRPVFVGDDVTDEDGFTAAAALGGFGVLVGYPRPTAAEYGFVDPSSVTAWLGL
jgi:trehalose 6-phosphate phosphatase